MFGLFGFVFHTLPTSNSFCSYVGVVHFFAGNKVFVCFLLFVVCPFSDIRLEARVKPI